VAISSEDHPGGVLGRTLIVARQEDIFASGFKLESVRMASYELRLAKTKLILPNGKRYPEGTLYEQPLILQSGEVAFASTEERFHMPTDLTANLSMKFTFASKGILGLNGMIVDPNYGSNTTDGSRLHFILANAGQQPIIVNLGSDRIASIQFFPVLSDWDDPKGPSTTTSPSIIDELFQDEAQSLGLSFFATQSRLAERIDTLEANVARDVRGLNNVVTFGHFLLGTAALGVVLTFLLSWMSSSRADAVVNVLSRHSGTATEILLSCIIVFVTIPSVVALLLKNKDERPTGKRK
jgi:deoxycytidine triphosphate deaminase